MINKISQVLLSACGQGIAQGKKGRDIILKDNPALNSYTGKYLRPHILHACTDYAINRNLLGIPNIRITEEHNSRNYSFLQIETEHFYMTTSYVDQYTTVPRDAHFRCVRAMSNHPYLFQELENQLPKGKPYLVLIHGLIETKREGEVVFEELFGGIGMPCGDMPTQWNEYLSLAEYIDLAKTIPEEIIDEFDPGFLKLKNKFGGNVDNNDSA
jgi:hypothetical protein